MLAAGASRIPCNDDGDDRGALAGELGREVEPSRPNRGRARITAIVVVVAVVAMWSGVQHLRGTAIAAPRHHHPPTHPIKMFAARECGGCQCDCTWANNQACTDARTTDCCFSCCCGGAVGVPYTGEVGSVYIDQMTNGAGLQASAQPMFQQPSVYQHAEYPSQMEQPLQFPGQQTAYPQAETEPQEPYPEMAGIGYGSQEPTSFAHFWSHAVSVHVFWWVLFAFLCALGCLALYMYFAQRK